MTKKISFLFALILGLGTLPSIADARPVPSIKNQNPTVYIDSLRTETTPGFFEVTVIPSSSLTPLRMREVYVLNFDYNGPNAEKYKELLSTLQGLGDTIVPATEYTKYKTNPYNRIIFIGDMSQKDEHLNFVYDESQGNIVEAFEQFRQEEISTLYLYDIKPIWGAGVSEVYPESYQYVGAEGATFIGKFDRDLATRLEVFGASNKGKVQALFSLPFDRAPLTEDRAKAAFNLPQKWELVSQGKIKAGDYFAPDTETKETNKWRSFLPFILGLFGLLLLVSEVIKQYRHRKDTPTKELPHVPEAHKEDEKSIWDDTDIPFRIDRHQ